MDLQQLRDALSEHDADPEAVRSQLVARRRTRRRGRLAAAAAAAAVLVVTAGSITIATRPGSHVAATASPAPGAGCADTPLAQQFRTFLAAGASVVTVTGATVLRDVTARDGLLYHQTNFFRVHTVAGPPISDGSTFWLATPEHPSSGRGNPGPLWGPGGAVFAVVLPRSFTGSKLGTTIVQAPIVGDAVVLGTSGGCWSTRGLIGKPFHGPLIELPGSGTYALAAAAGFTEVPLSQLKALATGK